MDFVNSETLKVMPPLKRYALMRNMIREGYDHNEYFEHYRQHRALQPSEKDMLDKFIGYASECGSRKPRILDVGCGDGSLYDTYLKSENCIVTGIDISAKQIFRARKNIPEFNYILGDFMDESPSELGQFAGIVCLYAFFCFPADMQYSVLAHMRSFLRDKGVILLLVRNEVKEYVTEEDWYGAPMCWSHVGINQISSWADDLDLYCCAYKAKHNEEYTWMLLRKDEDFPDY